MEKENSTVANVLFALTAVPVFGAMVSYWDGMNREYYLNEEIKQAAHMLVGHYCVVSIITLVFMGTLLNYVKWIADATELSVSKQKQSKVKNSGEINEPLGWVEKMLINED